jgi:flagellar basal body-associated protein FliL
MSESNGNGTAISKWIILIVTITVSLAILMTLLSWLIRGPSSVSPASQENMYALITLLIGLVSGYVLGRKS